jgi:hypothetical protein
VDWAVPLLTKNKTKCLVKITAFDASNNMLHTDNSALPFTIEVLTITDINAGTPCASGQICPITWRLVDTVLPDELQVSYTLDGGITWKTEPSTSMPSGPRYDWAAPAVKKTKTCKVKLTFKTAGKMVATAKSASFTINKP